MRCNYYCPHCFSQRRPAIPHTSPVPRTTIYTLPITPQRPWKVERTTSQLSTSMRRRTRACSTSRRSSCFPRSSRSTNASSSTRRPARSEKSPQQYVVPERRMQRRRENEKPSNGRLAYTMALAGYCCGPAGVGVSMMSKPNRGSVVVSFLFLPLRSCSFSTKPSHNPYSSYRLPNGL